MNDLNTKASQRIEQQLENLDPPLLREELSLFSRLLAESR